MAEKLTFKDDREADILHIDKCPPYAEQESEEIENLEVLFFSSRLFELPVRAAFQFADRQRSAA